MPPKNDHGWIWYFLILVVLTLAATIGVASYNLLQQLKPEQLEAARQQWKDSGLSDYSLGYTIKNKDEKIVEYLVQVKGGKVVEAYFNGLAETPDRLHYYGMDRLFDYIEKFQHFDAQKGQPRVYVRAYFDERTGAVLKYIRRVMGSRERVEITVEKLEAGKSTPD